MNDVVGSWAVAIKTPVGSLHVNYVFAEIDGVVMGTAVGNGKPAALTDVRVSAVDGEVGEQVSWRQTVTKHLRKLRVDFDVTVIGDDMIGQSRAGRSHQRR